MKSLISISDDYLEGKSIQTRIKRILNIIFSCFITSFVYIKFYGSYQWYDYNDYKGILNFILDGKFIIPIALFYIVDRLIYSVSGLIQLLIQNTIQKKCSNWLFERISNANKETIHNQTFDDLPLNSNYGSSDDSNSIFFRIYTLIRHKTISIEQKILATNRQKIEGVVRFQFEFNIKTMFSLVLFFYSNSSFGWKLFIILMIIQLANTILTVLVSLIFDLVHRLNPEPLQLNENANK